MEKKEPKLKITDEKLALAKIKNWCAYQERCQQETRDKLYEYGLWPEAVENIISTLISENFVNEERFAKLYAGGKFRIKKWGRIKIKNALKQKKITDYCIKKAIAEIDENEYILTLKKLLEIKGKQIKETSKIKKNYKLLQYAYSRGYEQDLISDLLNLSNERQ